mgnify:CR=1 FL=1
MRTNRFNTGKPFEHALEKIAAQYASRGLLSLRKVDPPLRYVGASIVHMANPFTDFIGCWSERGGRALFVEAKSTREPKLPVGKSGLTSAQIDAMHCWSAAGAAAFLLWECRGEVRLWSEAMIVDQTQNIRHLPYGFGLYVPAGQGWVLHDFLFVMRQLWPEK